MRAAGIALVIIIALALQTSLARFLTPGGGLVDLVFVAVVYIALSSGPTAGMIAGAVAGLSQDALAASGTLSVVIGAGAVSTHSIIGIGSLAKTVVGFFAGIVGSQFIVARPLPQGAGVLHSDGRPCDHICRAVPRHRPGVHAGDGRRDPQPGRRQCAGRRAGFSDSRFPAELRRSPAVDGRRGCGSTGGSIRAREQEMSGERLADGGIHGTN